MIKSTDLQYSSAKLPEIGYPTVKPTVSEKTFRDRLSRLTAKMCENALDAVVIYADREHYGNFKFFTGVDPRFEEAVLVVHADSSAYAVFGNECLNLAELSRIPVTPILCQALSLPNQPMDHFVSLEQTFRDCAIREGMKIGLVDWKLINERYGTDFRHVTAMPAGLVEALSVIVGDRKRLITVTDMLISADDGLRVCLEADAIAELEYGASVASQGVMDIIANAEPGLSELELVAPAKTFGQQLSCHTYLVTGKRTREGMVSPASVKAELGDEMVVSIGLEGGLTCRHAMLAKDGKDIRVDAEHYMEKVVKPYIAAAFNWIEMLELGACCGDIFDMVDSSFPHAQYGWSLNPGHLTAYEEWLSAPFYSGSKCTVRSGMIFQLDIIPNDAVYCAPNIEDGVLVADEALREQIRRDYPEVYARMMLRREFAEKVIGLKLKPELMPMSNCFAWFNPYMMSKDMAVVVRK